MSHPFSRCLFCSAVFGEPGAGARRRRAAVAFDPARGRGWVICSGCGRWNLVPQEERPKFLGEWEQSVADRGRLLIATDNIGLYEVDGEVVVRIGRATLQEQAWWRYGRILRARRAALRKVAVRASLLATGAAGYVGGKVGLVEHPPLESWDHAPLTDALRWWRFGWLAWSGRVPCPRCGSVLRSLSYEDGWWVRPLLDERGTVGVGVPCQRCDPWTPEKLYRISGPEAGLLLRRILAYQNIAGASDGAIGSASRLVERSGSLEHLVSAVSRDSRSLWKMGPAVSLALEMALSEAAERESLESQARSIEAAWREEEELARIVDEELTPGVYAAPSLGAAPEGTPHE